MTVGQAFDDEVEHYDQWVKTALPRYEELFSIAVSLLPFDTKAPIDILDLGAGTGLFSYEIWSKFQQAAFVLYDIAPKMLDVARARFQHVDGNFTVEEFDYRNLRCTDRFDAVISSLSIHHLEHREKQHLFSAIHDCLREGGVFVNVDQIKAPTNAIRDLYWSTWLAGVREKGAAENRIQASIQRRTIYDKDALLCDQLRWLTRAGFVDVDCVYKPTSWGCSLHGRWEERRPTTPESPARSPQPLPTTTRCSDWRNRCARWTGRPRSVSAGRLRPRTSAVAFPYASARHGSQRLVSRADSVTV